MRNERQDNPFTVGWLTGDALLSAAVLYTMGWSYISGYYSAFGISVNELSFDFREFMVLAERALLCWMCLAFGAACIAGSVLLLWYGHRTRARVSLSSGSEQGMAEEVGLVLVSITTTIILLVFLSWFSVWRGREDASVDMWEKSPTLPLVRLSLDKTKLPNALFTDDPPRDGAVEGFRMLAHGKNGYFIFRPLRADVLPHDKEPRGLSLRVLFLPDNSVLGTEITTGVTQ
jgi:hypothetical protein